MRTNFIVLALGIIVFVMAIALAALNHNGIQLDTLFQSTSPTIITLIDNHPSLEVSDNYLQKQHQKISAQFIDLFSSNSTKEVQIIIVDTPQLINFSWSDETPYIGYKPEVKSDKIIVHIYVNVAEVQAHNWSEDLLAREIEAMFYQSLFYLQDLQDNNFSAASEQDAQELLNVIEKKATELVVAKMNQREIYLFLINYE